MPEYDSSVFVNCPFDTEFTPLLEAMLFCIVRSGLVPRLASERLEAGESRLEKILGMIENCKFSVHDLSRAVSTSAGETFRMNMPFELGLDMGRRRAPDEETNDKKFLIFEKEPYELKKCLSDLAGVDVSHHKDDYLKIIKALRDFFTVEAGCELPGVTKLDGDYQDFQSWMIEKKIDEGHTEKEAIDIPTKERLSEMHQWMDAGRPVSHK